MAEKQKNSTYAECVTQDQNTPLDYAMLVFGQVVEKCIAAGDSFLHISVQTEEAKQRVLDAYAHIEDKYGEETAKCVFPSTTEKVIIVKDQPLIMLWKTLGEAEKEAFLELHYRFIGWVAQEMGPALGIPTMTMTKPNGEQIAVVPMLFDYQKLKQSFLNSLYPSFLGAIAKEEEKKRIKVATAENSGILRVSE